MKVVLSSGARRNLHRLHPKAAIAIIEFMNGPLCEDPLRISKPLVAPFDDLRCARRGPYRVLFEIDDETVSVLRIGHRTDVYRP